MLMGRREREKPKRLAEKLIQIRLSLGLSQSQMLSKLGLNEKLSRTAISGYELGTTEPPLPILLNYSRLAGVHLEVLVDDDMDLPERLPKQQGGINRKG
jgi:transcriptional regulator with XRE-family HTH domain